MSATISTDRLGLIIQYDFCTGCHACEVACKREHDFQKGEFGITVFEYGPAKKPDGRYDFFYLPAPTDLCDMCIERLEEGKLPACVHNCQSKVMEYGDVEELAKKMAFIPKCVLYAPGDKD